MTAVQSASFHSLLGQLSETITLLGHAHQKDLEQARCGEAAGSKSDATFGLLQHTMDMDQVSSINIVEQSPSDPLSADEQGVKDKEASLSGLMPASAQGPQPPDMNFAHPHSDLAELLPFEERLLDEINQIKVVQAGMAATLVQTSYHLETSLNLCGDAVAMEKQEGDLLKDASNAPQPASDLEVDAGMSKGGGSLNRITTNQSEVSLNPMMTHQTQQHEEQICPDDTCDPINRVFGEKRLSATAMLEVDLQGVRHAGASTRFMQRRVGQNEFLTRVCESIAFQVSTACLIILNTVSMSYETDLTMEARLAGKTGSVPIFMVLNLGFCILFCIELITKILAYRCNFFSGPDKMWNIFDIAVVATAMHHQIETFLSNEKRASWAFLRLLRPFKLSRLLRLLRILRFLRELRVIAINMIHSLRSLTWCMILIMLVTFVFGLAFTQGWSHFLEEREIDPQLLLEISERWGSTRQAMLTLYMCSTGGIDWGPAADCLWKLGPVYYWLFLLYVSFFLFLLANCITALIVDQGLQVSAQDESDIIEEDLRQKSNYVRFVEKLFRDMEKDELGNVSVMEFSRHLSDKPLVAFCAQMNIMPSELEHFFYILSEGGRKRLNLNTFVLGCIKLRGQARSADLVACLMEVRELKGSNAVFKAFCKQQFTAIHNDLLRELRFYRKQFTAIHDDLHASKAKRATSLSQKQQAQIRL